MVNKLVVNITSAGYSDFRIENISFTLEPGEVLLITGRSGSGKTTLLYSITGLIKIRNGYINGYVNYNGVNLLEKDLLEVLNKLMIIPQEPWYGIVGYTVYTEYCHTLSVYGLKCDTHGLYKTSLDNIMNQSTYTLSAGQYQRLLLSEAFIVKPEILLFDEPFTYIDQESRASFIKYIEELLSEKRIIIVVDHIPSNWKHLEPKLLVLDSGRVKYYGEYINLNNFNENGLKFEKKNRVGKTVLEARNIWFKYPGQKPLIRGISIDLHSFELIGIRGVNGVGKSTFLKILSGIYKPWRGFVKKYGSAIYVPENPLLYLTHPIPRLELESSCGDQVLLNEVIEVFGLKKVLDKPIKQLSSGERKRLVLASAFLGNYDIYLLDEPSGGLDYYSLLNILNIFEYIVEKGKSIVIAHHDPRLDYLFNREYLLSNGVLIEYS